MVACRPPPGTSEILAPAMHLRRSPLPRSTCPPRSTSRYAAAQRALPPVVGQANAICPAWLCLNVASQPSSQPTIMVLRRALASAQYVAQDKSRQLDGHGMVGSMSRKGDYWDNALMATWFGSLKAELKDDGSFPSRQAARTAVFGFIEGFYKSSATALRDRLHLPDPQRTTRCGRVGRNPCSSNRRDVRPSCRHGQPC